MTGPPSFHFSGMVSVKQQASVVDEAPKMFFFSNHKITSYEADSVPPVERSWTRLCLPVLHHMTTSEKDITKEK